ncbi:hypothetical protein DL98DRAFT_591040 [Cadophora sp. DSE1049]|nr:hypothetical protein DL98DRAFT_591040 [Cadophora sp. DSE1049]
MSPSDFRAQLVVNVKHEINKNYTELVDEALRIYTKTNIYGEGRHDQFDIHNRIEYIIGSLQESINAGIIELGESVNYRFAQRALIPYEEYLKGHLRDLYVYLGGEGQFWSKIPYRRQYPDGHINPPRRPVDKWEDRNMDKLYKEARSKVAKSKVDFDYKEYKEQVRIEVSAEPAKGDTKSEMVKNKNRSTGKRR